MTLMHPRLDFAFSSLHKLSAGPAEGSCVLCLEVPDDPEPYSTPLLSLT